MAGTSTPDAANHAHSSLATNNASRWQLKRQSFDLQALFDDPIVEQTYLDRDYSGFGNDVWVVRTAAEHVVVRVSACEGAGGAFWAGVERLFGVDSTDLDRLRVINGAVNATGGLPAPQVLRCGETAGRQWAVTQLMPGLGVHSFDEVSPGAAEAFGRFLARGHQRRFAHCGSPGAPGTYPAADFHRRAADVMEWLAREYRDAAERERAAECAAALRAIPAPPATSLTLLDIGGSQYLWDADGPTAVVDTEVFVYAPPELELIVLESDNGRAFCESFKRGYESVGRLPELRHLRAPYRCLIALLEVNGEMTLDDALQAPAWLE